MDNKKDMTNTLKEVSIFCDGACQVNPGLAGWGVLLVYFNGKKEYRKEIYGGFQKSTNNRMELNAVIQGLTILKERCKVVIYTDSQYITNAFNLGWLDKWQARNWHNIKNVDLWKQLLKLCANHTVKFVWVKGHNGHPEQERSDFLANQGLKANPLLIDFGYEQELAKQNAQESLLTA